MLLPSFMDMALLTLLPNLEFHLHFFASVMLSTLITTTPIDLPSSSACYASFLSSSMSRKTLYALKGKSAIISKPTPIVQTFVIDPTSKLGGPKPKKKKPNNIIE
jgi:hypothetical protein